nr:hypothetical protein [Lelliottia steviae]|tara:strand:+ start:553 stop:741 length:189 start_codon:yes stop_codon:yes gene_type:complete
MMEDLILKVVITAVITGGVSAATTVIALRIHINYMKEGLKSLVKKHDELGERVRLLEINAGK